MTNHLSDHDRAQLAIQVYATDRQRHDAAVMHFVRTLLLPGVERIGCPHPDDDMADRLSKMAEAADEVARATYLLLDSREDLGKAKPIPGAKLDNVVVHRPKAKRGNP